MELKPKLPQLKRVMCGLAVLFFFYGTATAFAGHDPKNGLWALVVAFALTLGFLPDWLAGSAKTAESVQPEKYNMIPR